MIQKRNITGGDNRFYNNVFIGSGQSDVIQKRQGRMRAGYGTWMYTDLEFPTHAAGNLYYHGAVPSPDEHEPLSRPELNPQPRVVEENGKLMFSWSVGEEIGNAKTAAVSTKSLGDTAIVGAAYENPNGLPLSVDRDLLGVRRSDERPTAGPFERPATGETMIELTGF